MKPVWIKYYGLIPMTKKGYLRATGIACAFAATCFLAAFLMGRLPPFHWPGEAVVLPREANLGELLYNHFYEVIASFLFLEVIDIALTLRTFARKEAEQR